MSTLSIAKRNADISYSAISSFRISAGETVVLKLSLDDEVPHTFKMWAACAGNADPNNSGNRQGKEACNEGWLKVRVEGETSWSTLTFPASFPATFSALSAFEFSISTPVYLEFAIEVPADAESVGDVGFNLSFRGLPT